MKIVLPAGRPRHEMTLRDGSLVTLSPVLKSDRELFQKGFQELSIDSRFARFGQGVAGLSARELDYLTDVDQRTHVAWGAAIDGEVAGVGRYILDTEENTAEVAITVLDPMQNRGVGTALLSALIATARADEVEELWFEAMADNAAVKRLLGEIEVGQMLTEGVLERRIRLVDFPPIPDENDLVVVLEEARG